MTAGDLNKTPSYTENVPVSVGYSNDLSGASGVIKIVIAGDSTSTYYGRFTTTISTTTASSWDTETQTWTVEGTLAECNVAMNDLCFEPARGISSNPVYTISCYEDGTSSTVLGHTSTITFTGSALVATPALDDTSTTTVTYSAGTRTKVTMPEVSHAGNAQLEIQLRLLRLTADPLYDATDPYLPKRSDYASHDKGPIARQEWTDYGYLDTRVYAGNKSPEIKTGNLHSVSITGGGAGYVQAPKVTVIGLSSLGTAAEVTATVSGSVVSALTIVQPGKNYIGATLVINSTSYDFGASLPVTSTATAEAVVSDDYIWSFTGTVGECNEILRQVYYVPYDSSFNKTVNVELKISDGSHWI